MSGVENRFLEASAECDGISRGGVPDERSLILEEKLDEIVGALFDEPLPAFRAVRAYAERRIDELESAQASREAGARPMAAGLDGEPERESEPPDVPLAVRAEEFFRQERSTYELRKAALAEYEGWYVVIRGEEVAGVWLTYEEALDGGYSHFGPVAFFVKQIAEVEPGPPPFRGSPPPSS